jgi:hypothetical protein
MQQAGDGHLRWGRAPRLATDSFGVATWQQRTTLSAALLGAFLCAWLIVELLALHIDVPGLGSPIRTPPFAPSAPAVHTQPRVAVRPPAPAAASPQRPKHTRIESHRTVVPTYSPTPVTGEVPAPAPTAQPAPPPAPAPQPQPQPPAANVPPPEPAPAPAASVPVAVPTAPPAPALPELPPLPELPVSVPSVPVPLPAIP